MIKSKSISFIFVLFNSLWSANNDIEMIITETTTETFKNVMKNMINAIMNIANLMVLFSFFNISLFSPLNNLIKYNANPTIRIAAKIYAIIDG